jgi:hypothetical protein
VTALRRLALIAAGDAPAVADADDTLAVRVVTFGPGDDIAEWFGHAAIVVEDKATKTQHLYNFGEYSFDETVVRRYAMGRLLFSVGQRNVEKTLQLYAAHDRDVRVQELDLSPAQKLVVKQRLEENVRPENRNYLYDHYQDNCTTRIRDLLDDVLGGQLHAQAAPTTKTYRTLTRRQTAVSPVMAFVIDFILNDSTDAPMTTWEEAFLPEEFERQLHDATIIDGGERRPLVKAASVWWKATRPPPPPPPSVFAHVVAGVALAAAVFAVRRRRAAFAFAVTFTGFVVGVFGSVLFFMAFFTDHHVAFGNENLLVANPLALLLMPAGVLVLRGRRRMLQGVTAALAVLAGIALLAKLLPGQDQDNARILAVAVPLLVSLAFSAHATRVPPLSRR